MDNQSSAPHLRHDAHEDQQAEPKSPASATEARFATSTDAESGAQDADVSARLLKHFKSRPPPPPPLTPPELSRTVFSSSVPRTRPYTAVAVPSTTSTHQSKPDYGSSTSSTTSGSTAPSADSPSMPRHKSYTKKVIDVGGEHAVVTGTGTTTTSNNTASSSDRDAMSTTPEPVSAVTLARKKQLPFLPSSYSSTAPFLPPPPPYAAMTEAAVSVPTDRRKDWTDASAINIQDEIISVMDDAGVGWRRHTRVYGGGVCLACAASASGGGGGGLYGNTATTE